jgi:hypothetical protein
MIAEVTPQNDSARHPISLSVRTTVEQFEHLQEISDRLGVSISDVVRVAISRGLEGTYRAIADAIDSAERERAQGDF